MVYEPREDSFLLQRYVKKYAKGKSVLDIGAGSGIQAEAALKAGASSVMASDINPEAMKLLKKKNISAVQSDLFSGIHGKFGLIIFNPPYLPEDEKEPQDSRASTTGGKRGDEIILKFLRQAPRHLSREGIILIVVSSLTPKDRIKSLMKHLKLSYQALEPAALFFETLEVWKINRY